VIDANTCIQKKWEAKGVLKLSVEKNKIDLKEQK
jgi:hypothetical protein